MPSAGVAAAPPTGASSKWFTSAASSR